MKSCPISANLLPLGIGSMPFTSPQFCCDTAISYYPSFPYWPQMPNLNNYENMYIQYSEALPGAVLSIDKGSIFVDTDIVSNREKEVFYENILNENSNFFKISETFTKCLYLLKNILNNSQLKYTMLKGHVTGPISFGLTVTDKMKKSLIYNDEYRDIITELVGIKGKWQEDFFGENMIIFFDEPYMVSYGSAFFNMPEDIIIDIFNRCFSKISGLSGIHCCGNTDWSLILKSNVNIINFDAFLYMDNFLLYGDDIKNFIQNGGFLAWGIIPTNEKIRDITIDEIDTIFNKAVSQLSKKGLDREELFKQSFITPSCGTGSMKEDDALRVFELNKLFSNHLREKFKIT